MAASKKPIVCVTGSSGCVGQALIKHLLPHYHVKALFRSESAKSNYFRSQGCEIIFGDLHDTSALASLTKDTDAVFHAAAYLGKGDYNKSHQINVEGTKNLLKAAHDSGCKTFIYVSSISVYCATPVNNMVYTEEIEPVLDKAMNNYSRTKLESELLVKKMSHEYGMSFIIIRPTNIYGPDSQPWFLRILKMVRRFPVTIGDLPIDMVYVDDVVQGMIEAYEHPKGHNQAFNIGNETVKLKDFISLVGKMDGRKIIATSGLFDYFLRRIIQSGYTLLTKKKPPLSFVRPAHYLHTKAAKIFGYQPTVSLADGLLESFYSLHASDKEEVFSPQHIFNYNLSHFHAAETIKVKKEEDIIAAVKKAKAHHMEIRAAGTMGSKNINFHTAGIALDMNSYNNIINIKGTNITVEAGMSILELCRLLHSVKLAIPTLGEWSGLTVSGAISTPTHGGSLHHGILASSVHSLRIIAAEGTPRTLTKKDELFSYALVSCGMFGIISHVTFECVPQFRLALQKEISTFHAYLIDLDEINSSNEYFSAIWIPVTGNVLRYTENKTTRDINGSGREKRFSFEHLFVNYLSNTLHTSIFFKEKMWQNPPVGEWDAMLSPIGPFSLVEKTVREHTKMALEFEAGVDIHNAREVLRKIEHVFSALHIYPSCPVGLRCSKKDSLKLSPCFERDTFWISMFIKDDPLLLQRVCEVLMQYKARFHWGKNIPVPPQYTAKQYHSWKKAMEIKKKIDPEGIFSNSFTRWLGD